MARVLVTGVAGFIGSHMAHALLRDGDTVYGLDNINSYYDPGLKETRLSRLSPHPNFRFERIDLADAAGMNAYFEKARPDKVMHLAAQAGVRYSMENPHAYIDSNITGFLNVLESCRRLRPGHLVYASSSSVYGLNREFPLATRHGADHPVSLYAASKRSNELMAHSYSHTYGIPVTGLRFFTVYGPWGRPDMAPVKFAQKILRGEAIEVYNHGKHQRDFTYVDDIVDGALKVLRGDPPRGFPSGEARPDRSPAPYAIYNIGSGRPIQLEHFIEVMERVLGKRAERRYVEAQAGDVEATWADIGELQRDYGYQPQTRLEVGMREFADWFRSYYKI
jgi:UDP-glucuronate 4-epimerase